MTEHSGNFAVLAGVMARATGLAAGECPYPAGSPQARCWAYGWATRDRADETVSRETVVKQRARKAGKQPGWSASDLAVLAICGDMRDADLAAILGRSHQAVRCKLTRLRHPAAGGAA